IRREVRSQLGGRRWADLDGMNGSPSGQKILRRLPSPRTDLHDLRVRRQRPEESVEELRRIRRPHLVVDLRRLVELEPYVLWPGHDVIMPERRTPGRMRPRADHPVPG